MPSITLHPRPQDPGSGHLSGQGLPGVLQTPSGLAIVEIQGTVNAPQTTDENASIGRIVFPHYDASKGPDDTSWQKRVHFYVGQNQRMTGEVKKLAKPLALVRRRRQQRGSDAGPDEREELEIAEIVRYKITFAHRPEPVGGERA